MGALVASVIILSHIEWVQQFFACISQSASGETSSAS
jgi:hypothetical protein